MTPPFTDMQAALIATLRLLGIARVEIEYDGESDNGQITGVLAFDAEGRFAPLQGSLLLPAKADDACRKDQPLSSALEDFAWAVLQHYHSGFEDNDGGFGTLVIEPPSSRVHLEHNARVLDFFTTVTKV
jgi:hypothetical protein